jgi:NAD-dependent deacetylase
MSRKVITILSGAGISRESGLQTFRDMDGLWEGYNVEEVCTPQALKNNPEMVLDLSLIHI